jgi:hypothetical protein
MSALAGPVPTFHQIRGRQLENHTGQLSLDSVGGAERDRTVDLLNAIQALSQLSYGPTRAV